MIRGRNFQVDAVAPFIVRQKIRPVPCARKSKKGSPMGQITSYLQESLSYFRSIFHYELWLLVPAEKGSY
jgi:hypothetical protein